MGSIFICEIFLVGASLHSCVNNARNAWNSWWFEQPYSFFFFLFLLQHTNHNSNRPPNPQPPFVFIYLSLLTLATFYDIIWVSASVTLNNIIQKNFPEEYAERRTEHQSLTNLGVDLMPLFVMDVVIPCQKFPLHIFEPRYRLMVSSFACLTACYMSYQIRTPSKTSASVYMLHLHIIVYSVTSSKHFLCFKFQRGYSMVRRWLLSGKSWIAMKIVYPRAWNLISFPKYLNEWFCKKLMLS